MAKAKGDVPEKKKVSVKIDDVYLDLGYSDIDSAIRDLTEAREKCLAAGYTSLNLQYVRDCGCYGSCDCEARLRLFGERFETDAEFEARSLKEIAQKEAQAARDRAEFERLSKVYGKA